ncbi:hypothetical protein ACFYO7_31795 [Nocardia salmonicida]|uniref:hypothetical protein n=1 Tax=Nocardia salmonicida TaxID=53431 RepID=UPI003698A682
MMTIFLKQGSGLQPVTVHHRLVDELAILFRRSHRASPNAGQQARRSRRPGRRDHPGRRCPRAAVHPAPRRARRTLRPARGQDFAREAAGRPNSLAALGGYGGLFAAIVVEFRQMRTERSIG